VDASREAAPATTGLATLVPLRVRQPVVILLPDTSLPYAITSGLMRPEHTTQYDITRLAGVVTRDCQGYQYSVRHLNHGTGSTQLLRRPAAEIVSNNNAVD
jgi:hypothetical protein